MVIQALSRSIHGSEVMAWVFRCFAMGLGFGLRLSWSWIWGLRLQQNLCGPRSPLRFARRYEDFEL